MGAALAVVLLHAVAITYSSTLFEPPNVEQLVERDTTIVLLPPYMRVDRLPATGPRKAVNEPIEPRLTNVQVEQKPSEPRRLRLSRTVARVAQTRSVGAAGTRIPNLRLQDVGGSVARGGITVSNPSYVYDPPELLELGESKYPGLLRNLSIVGLVVVDFAVDTLGRAERESIVVVESTHRAFNDAARDAVANGVYRPGRVNGRPLRVLARLELTFTP